MLLKSWMCDLRIDGVRLLFPTSLLVIFSKHLSNIFPYFTLVIMFNLRKRFLIPLFLFLITAFFGYQPAQAQEATASGPVYVVQSGDTISGIALRFSVTVDEILTANALNNANQIFVGDRIVIPGLDGVEGVLTTRSVAFGENYRSLRRQFQLNEAIFNKLNRLASPAELALGAPIVIPVPDGNPVSHTRDVLRMGETPLEQAVRLGTQTWSLAAYNGFALPTDVLPGDIVMFAGSDTIGPGAFPALFRETEVTPLYQGSTGMVALRLQEEIELTLTGQLGPYTLHFFPDDQQYVALQGVYTFQKPGVYPLTITGQTSDGVRFGFEQMVPILSRDYIFEYINVPPALIDPETTEREIDEVDALLAEISEEKLWNDIFQAPSPFEDCINSSFGNRRSYNGSAFNFYHGGVDYCGGTGTEIYAPADGIIRFAGEKEVRGGYTIIDHGWGIFSGYMHQSEIFVEIGQEVKAGDVIGLVGNTGRSTGAHLHWEIWVGGELVNPLDWLARAYP